MAQLGAYAQSVKDWMQRGKTYEQAHDIATRGTVATGYETLNGVQVPTGFKEGKTTAAVDPYAEIKRQQEALLAAQKQARIQALAGQRQSALSALEAERSTVAPEFLKQRGTLQTTAQQAGRGAQQSLAARGLASSGAAVQSDIARNVALQQGMTSIGEAEADTLANIARRQSDVENAYSTGVAQAESEIAAQQAQAQIDLLMKAQELEEARAAEETKNKFQFELLAQEQANKEAIEKMRIAAEDARAKGDFDREKELSKYKNDLEKENIRLRASLEKKSGGSGGVSASLANTMLNQQVDEIIGGIAARTGDMTAEEYNAYVLQRLRSIQDPVIRSRVESATGVTYRPSTVTSYQISGPSGTSNVPSWLNTRNLPGLG